MSIENPPQKPPVQEQVEKDESFVDFQRQEEALLQTVTESSPRTAKLKRAFQAITAGTLLLAGTAGFVGETHAQSRRHSRPSQSGQAVPSERIQQKPYGHGESLDNTNILERLKKEKQEILARFNVPGLSLGKPQRESPYVSEQYGLYMNELYLGHLFPDKTFPKSATDAGKNA